ncbi:hypothetical protein PAHAL_2G020300 [Panicum hallii]|uniref:Uncharacterized protein n=1 Tax=Panicum hallii TaxID=206008 RepID=A0A2T8KMM4_9POAL|nr:hypothetical protein PAHAL_2G020300 [Panicum hallii]
MERKKCLHVLWPCVQSEADDQRRQVLGRCWWSGRDGVRTSRGQRLIRHDELTSFGCCRLPRGRPPGRLVPGRSGLGRRLPGRQQAGS